MKIPLHDVFKEIALLFIHGAASLSFLFAEETARIY